MFSLLIILPAALLLVICTPHEASWGPASCNGEWRTQPSTTPPSISAVIGEFATSYGHHCDITIGKNSTHLLHCPSGKPQGLKMFATAEGLRIWLSPIWLLTLLPTAILFRTRSWDTTSPKTRLLGDALRKLLDKNMETVAKFQGELPGE
jgi:hypothetical protein